jgi:hypothetical protein
MVAGYAVPIIPSICNELNGKFELDLPTKSLYAYPRRLTQR